MPPNRYRSILEPEQSTVARWARERYRCWLTAWLIILALAYAAVPRGHGQQLTGPVLHVSVSDNGNVLLSWPASAADFVLEETSSLSGNAWQPVSLPPQISNNQFTISAALSGVTRFYRLRQTAAASTFLITRHTPLDGATEVGVTFRPRIFFSKPVNPAALSPDNFFAKAGGVPLEAKIVPANDGSFAWLFFKQAMPGGTRVRVTVDGSSILSAEDGALLDGNGDGSPGGVLNFDFATVSRVALPGTSLSGIVVDPGPDLKPLTADDVDPGADGLVNTLDDWLFLPIAGVKVYLLGREEEVVTTGFNGVFHFDSVPAGDVKVVIDGRTASDPPAGMYFPEMVIDAQMIPGITNYTMLGMPPVYLPRLSTNILQAIDASKTNIVAAKPEGASGLTPDQRQHLTIEVPPASLVAADGTKLNSGQIGISTVPPELVRDMLPPGVLQHTFDVTVQAPGIATFSTPAPMTFPNVFNAAPGTQLNFLSFDHTTGRLVIEGTATVSADGQTVRTDPGTGVTHPGWHGLTAPGGPAGPDGPPAVCSIDLGTDNLSGSSVAAGRSLRPSSLASTITLNLPKALPMIVGETGALSDPALTWSGPPAGDVCGLKVQIEVDGPLDKFMKKTGNLALKSQTFTLRPGSSKTKTFSGIAKTYDEIFGKGKFTNFISDELLGAKITVRTSRLKSTGPPDVTVDTYYLYRWVNVNYPPGFLGGPGAVAANATAAFRKTLNDGMGGWSTMKRVVAALPTNSSTHFLIALPPLSPKTFDVSGTLTNRQFQWEFDPPSAGQFKQEMTIQVDDGYDTEVGKLTLLGHGIDPARVNLNLDGYKAELKRVILNLRNVTSLRTPGFVFPLYIFSANAPGLPPVIITRRVSGLPEDNLNNVPGGATNVSDGLDLLLGTKDDIGYKRSILVDGPFQQLFQGFMPEDRRIVGPDGIVGSPDDSFDATQLAALDALIDTEANKLPGLIAQQFNPVNFLPNAIQFVDTGAPINCQWTDVFVTLGDGRGYGTTSAGMPVFGLGDFGMDQVKLKSLLPHPKLPLGAKFWALAEGLNVNATNLVSLSAAMNLDYSGPDTFAAYVANTVSHEIGHTLGLLDAYSNDGKIGTALCRPSTGNCIPFDIMQNGQSSDAYLRFAPGNIGLLKAAVGVAGTRAGPLSFTKNEPPLLIELNQYRKTFNLGKSSTGIRENNPLDPPPTEPEISVFQEDNSFFGEADEALEIAGEIAADGVGGDFIDMPFTILNSGYGPLTLDKANFLAGTKGFAVVNASAALGQPITPGRSITLTVRFDPLAGGAASDTLQLTSDAASMPLLRLPITATAFANAPTVLVELVGINNFTGAIPGTAAIALPEIFRVRNAGQTALQITAIAFVQGAGAFTLTGVPANLASQPIQLAHAQSFIFGGSFQPDQTGLRRAQIEIKTSDPQTPIVRVSFVGTGLGVPVQADWGDDFVAIESPDFPATPPLRAKSDAKGNFEFFLPSEVFYHLAIFDPVTGLIGHETDATELSGQRTLLVDTMVFNASTEPDSDYDGLPDDIEFAIGTNPNKADVDGDGVDDFAEVSQGLDPFGGRALPLGIIGQMAIQGEAMGVVVVPLSANGENPMAVVAAGTGGLAMIDLGKPTLPILLNQLPLPGDATDVAVDSDLRIAAVAANAGGLHLVDISDAALPRLLATCSANAERVEVVNGVAYFASGRFLRAMDLLSREALPALALPGSVVGMTREGTMLYLTDAGSFLHLVDVSGETMKLRGQLAVGGPFVRSPARQPAVGNGIAYLALAQAGSGGGGGYATVDVTNPNAPQLISGTGVPPDGRAPGDGLALNASGLGVLIGSLPVGIQTNVYLLDVMNVSDPAQTYVFISRINLPAAPQSVTIAEGLAYVACGSAGLVMVNYLSYDGQGRPPTVSILADAVDVDLNRSGVQVVEGTSVPIHATIRDDVQAANVELLVNGQVVQSRLSFPFNLEAVAPSAAENGGRFTVQVRATDTGGNVGVSDPLLIEALPDARAFGVESVDPAIGHIVPTDNGVIEVVFTKPMHPRWAASDNFLVMNPQGLAIRPKGFELREAGRSVRMRLDTLPPDEYTLVLRSSAIRDYSGNALGAANFTSQFSTRVFTMRWTGLAGPGKLGLLIWRNPANWCPARVPGPEDSVYINVPRTNIVVLLLSGVGDVLPNGDPLPSGTPLPVELRSLVSNEELALESIYLRATEFIQVNNFFDFNGGSIRDTLLLSHSNTVFRSVSLTGVGGIGAEGFGNLLNRVTMKGDFVFDRAAFDVVNTFTLEGNIYNNRSPLIDGGGQLFVPGDALFEGTGTFHNINLHPTFKLSDDLRRGPVVTLGTNITFRGHFNVVMGGVKAKLINRGRLLLDQPAATDLAVDGFYYTSLNMINDPSSIEADQPFINEGTIEVSNGYRFYITGTPGNALVNRGVLRVRDRSRLSIISPMISPKTICDAGGFCYLGGGTALTTGPGEVSELSGAGRWVSSKEFRGGTVRLTDGAVLEGEAIFSNMVFEGELHNYDWNERRVDHPEIVGAGYGIDVIVKTNLTLNGLIQFHRSQASGNPGRLLFSPRVQRLEGQGRIEFEGSSDFNQIGQLPTTRQNSLGLFLTIGADITIHGSKLTIGGNGGNSEIYPPLVLNFGTLLASQPGDQLRLASSGFTNSGTIHVGTNNVVTITGNFSQSASGRLEFEVAGTILQTTHGQIQVPSGNATLDGVLNVNVRAPFQPSAGDFFELLTYKSHVGNFGSIEAPPPPIGPGWAGEYGPSSFRLRLR